MFHDLIVFSINIINLLKGSERNVSILNEIYMVTSNNFYTYMQHNGDESEKFFNYL